MPEDCEHIPGPILIPISIRVSELLSGPEARLIISKPRFTKGIFGFWNPLYIFREENAVLQTNQVNLICILIKIRLST
jgi:hypothetical protein